MLVGSFVTTIGAIDGIKVTVPFCRIEAAELFGGDCSDSYGGSDMVMSVCISCKSMYRTGGIAMRGGGGDVAVVDAVDNGLPFRPARFLEWLRRRTMIHIKRTIHNTDNIKPIAMPAN